MAEVEVKGVTETLRAFRGLPKQANKELRQAAKDIVRALTPGVAAAAAAEGGAARLMAPTVRPASDRLPALQAGGTRKVGRNKTPAYKLVARTEQGADPARLPQFKPYRESGHWFKPSIDRRDAEIMRQWESAADRIAKSWAAGGE